MPIKLPDWENTDINILKEFSSVELIAVDIDGTLLNSENPKVWNIILDLINKVTRKDKIEILIATGRTLHGAKTTIESIYKKSKLPVVLYNGSIVIRSGDFRVLYKMTISKIILENLILQFLKFNISIYAYYYLDDSELLFANENKTEYVLGWTNGIRTDFEFNHMQIDWKNNWEYMQNDPSAILIDICKETENNIKFIEEALRDISEISITSSGFSYIEIRPINSNKAKALEFVSNYLKVPKKRIVAIGDNDNDAEMLSWAGIGVSISNATPKALNSSRFQCSHNVASGVLEVLRIIRSSKRYIKHYGKTT